ncbi:RNA polymerase sigma factor [Chitinophaga costaii]|nr:RNA polymerase sigma factor [Chitinophaga costaii]PUZ30594.1 RNA polymerase sigma factor [Chitinophaga costaii]
MIKIKEGNLDGMRLLFVRYNRPLYGFLFRMTNDRETSEDIVQEVFYRMLKSRHTFMGTGEFRTWMYHLSRNVLKDVIRKHKKAGHHFEMTAFEERIDSGAAADEKLLKQQEAAMVQEALGRLSPEFREVLILSRYQDLRYSEIAAILDITQGAVKVRVHRAIEQLKQIFLKTAY